MRNVPQLLSCKNPDLIEAGCDEAGRGPLAGPVFAAAVILPKDFHHPLLNDSKKMTEKARETLRPIIEKEAVAWAVEEVTAEEIDTINILNASMLAMKRAIESLKTKPDYALIDGNIARGFEIDARPVIKGDALSPSIAAASILAKVSRDRHCMEMDKEYPEYGFEKHKGYGTKAHYEALRQFGASSVHRSSFLKKFYGEK